MHARNDGIITPKDEMRTPPWLFKLMQERFGEFNIDIATDKTNSLCREFYWRNEANPAGFLNPEVHLTSNDLAYGNPPYSKGSIEPFVIKAKHEAVTNGATTVMLLPVDMSTRWWNHMMEANEWWRVPIRVHFYGIDGQETRGSPWFDSIIAVFKPVRLAYQPHVRTFEIPEHILKSLCRRKRKHADE